MKTNTFIFNFINPSRLVLKTPSATSPESAQPPEIKPDALTAEKQHEQAVKKAGEEYKKAWEKELEAIDKLTKAKQAGESEDIAKNMQLAADASVKRQEAGSALAELRASELRDPWAEKKVVFTEDALEKGGFRTINPYDLPEKKREIVKADPKTKKAIEALLKSPSDVLKKFLAADHTGKNWKDLNKEFLTVLGITGGSERSHIKALQEVLFGEKVRDTRASDGQLGAFTLAKLQNRLGVKPQQNLEGESYDDKVLAFLEKKVDFSKLGEQVLEAYRNATTKNKINALKLAIRDQKGLKPEQVDAMIAKNVNPLTLPQVPTPTPGAAPIPGPVIASAEPEDAFMGPLDPQYWELYGVNPEPEAIPRTETPKGKPSAADQQQQKLAKAAEKAAAAEKAEKVALVQNKTIQPEWVKITYDKSRIKSNGEALKAGVKESYTDLINVIGYLRKEGDYILEKEYIEKGMFSSDVKNKYKGIFDKVSPDIKTAYRKYSGLDKKMKEARYNYKKMQDSNVYTDDEKDAADKKRVIAEGERYRAIDELNKTIWREISTKQEALTAWLEKHDTITNELSIKVPDLKNKSVENIINDKNRTKVFDNFADLVLGCNKQELSKLEVEIKNKNNGNCGPQDLLNSVNDYILSKNAIALASFTSDKKLDTAIA
jgi:hypothetical protein